MTGRLLAGIMQKPAKRIYGRRIKHALALHRRGEVRHDGLAVRRCSTALEIEWCARDVHPWDRREPRDQRAQMFVRQSIADTQAAIHRLFTLLPEVDVIAATVVEPRSGDVILAGTVHRAVFHAAAHLSPGMQLRECGIHYRSDGFHFEPLEKVGEEHRSFV